MLIRREEPIGNVGYGHIEANKEGWGSDFTLIRINHDYILGYQNTLIHFKTSSKLSKQKSYPQKYLSANDGHWLEHHILEELAQMRMVCYFMRRMGYGGSAFPRSITLRSLIPYTIAMDI